MTIADPIPQKAIQAIADGDLPILQQLVAEYPALLSERLINNEKGYFNNPYLLYFIADNPIRQFKLATNIMEIAAFLVQEVQRVAPSVFKEQVDYTLGLVATGRIPKECGVQLPLMDLLIDAGATPGSGLGALAHGNPEAARHLIERGGHLALATAAGLDQKEDVNRLLPLATANEKLVALTVAAFYRNTEMIVFLLNNGIDPNGYPANTEGFHSHATPLHQAVSSGSLHAVELLVEAGARLDLRDKLFDGTPADWAAHMQTEKGYDEEAKKNFARITEYLQTKTH